MPRYIAYYLSPYATSTAHATKQTAHYTKQVETFINSDEDNQLCDAFYEDGPFKKNRTHWPALEAAMNACIQHQAILLLSQFKKVITNKAFTERLLMFTGKHPRQVEIAYQWTYGDVRCFDYPTLTRENLSHLITQTCQQRHFHRERILKGLSRASAKRSGNPNALKIINLVNLPKINNAIIFALHLAPLVDELQAQGLSQRKMVAYLNAQKITAPEGGKWVLSQLQKVLERIKINQLAMAYETQFKSFLEQDLTHKDIAQILTNKHIPCPKKQGWDEALIGQMVQRMTQFDLFLSLSHFIVTLSDFIPLKNLPNLSPEQFQALLDQHHCRVPPQILTLCE